MVPSDAPRQQIAAKFQGLGVLPAAEVVDGDFLTPVVGVMRSGLSTVVECDDLVLPCNVVVATSARAGEVLPRGNVETRRALRSADRRRSSPRRCAHIGLNAYCFLSPVARGGEVARTNPLACVRGFASATRHPVQTCSGWYERGDVYEPCRRCDLVWCPVVTGAHRRSAGAECSGTLRSRVARSASWPAARMGV